MQHLIRLCYAYKCWMEEVVSIVDVFLCANISWCKQTTPSVQLNKWKIIFRFVNYLQSNSVDVRNFFITEWWPHWTIRLSACCRKYFPFLSTLLSITYRRATLNSLCTIKILSSIDYHPRMPNSVQHATYKNKFVFFFFLIVSIVLDTLNVNLPKIICDITRAIPWVRS